MKRILLLLSFISLLHLSVYSQDPIIQINENGDEYISEVIENKLLKDDLFSNSQEWIAKTFGDYKSVIQFEDKDDGKLIIKGGSPIDYIGRDPMVTIKINLNYTITIECKDLKYRYTISDFSIEQERTLLGRTNFVDKDRSEHSSRIDKMSKELNSLINKLDSLNSINQSNLKKKELSVLNNEREKTTESIRWKKIAIEDDEIFLEKENEALLTLSNSLKRAMIKDNSF
ncbi:MAG: DUF4468 domain-containing protein [Tannerella sp.]|jgi:uncharacterized coiled-coil protein SlyX|nr:DUF4468 domain-containing protein [Tannerella sp.]